MQPHRHVSGQDFLGGTNVPCLLRITDHHNDVQQKPNATKKSIDDRFHFRILMFLYETVCPTLNPFRRTGCVLYSTRLVGHVPTYDIGTFWMGPVLRLSIRQAASLSPHLYCLRPAVFPRKLERERPGSTGRLRSAVHHLYLTLYS